MNLPKLVNFDFRGKKVLVRCDFDVPLNETQKGQRIVGDDSRIKECLPVVQYLLDHAAQVILMGHLGRPEGKVIEELRMGPVAQKLKELLNLQFTITNFQLANFLAYRISENVLLLENLRFFAGEEKNDPQFSKELASLGDFYVNEAFASSHRGHASIVGLPILLPHCAGFHFAKEAENLTKVLEDPKKPLVFVIGGAKPETKLPMVEEFAKRANFVLVGGTLCQIANARSQSRSPNVKYAQLTNDGFDIDSQSIKEFCDIIDGAGTVVWNGPMGKFEEERWEAGTKSIAQAVAECSGFKLVGGGDTIAALTKFNLIGKMDYVSTAGGAMLEYLAHNTLPGIEALK